MKSRLLLALLFLALALPAFAPAEADAALSDAPLRVFETVKWNADFPKNAQILQATEFMCKVEGHQLRLLLIEATQNVHIETAFGKSACILLYDLETGETLTYANCVWPESSEIGSRQDALNMIFSCYLSYLEGYNEWVYADHELSFPLSEEEIQSINAALMSHFVQ